MLAARMALCYSTKWKGNLHRRHRVRVPERILTRDVDVNIPSPESVTQFRWLMFRAGYATAADLVFALLSHARDPLPGPRKKGPLEYTVHVVLPARVWDQFKQRVKKQQGGNGPYTHVAGAILADWIQRARKFYAPGVPEVTESDPYEGLPEPEYNYDEQEWRYRERSDG